MVPIPQSPTQMSLRHRDTGFPESFCGSRNTTLPHPEANLSPDACITEEDVNPARALIRYRMSFMTQQSGSRSSTFSDQTFNGSVEEGTLSALGRLAINSLRTGELPSLDGCLLSKDADIYESSDGMSSRDPESPLRNGKEFDQAKTLPRDAVRGRRGHRRHRSSFMSRLIHR
ncbi:hypothetical protein N657DRAFT_641588 [Parathielavia appendiculata]|uniref:Uncharacterized protein n=1 Tax=Parathielavia appendiculata TaxID=2587402 RepID=A0AAN6Z745_9PEZI|nr:hypothetical protein N657DRAFT_641588 [Parathielavia appendiculata]